jgi:hypothetical protein
MSNILIVSYELDPSVGIGGKRWSHFARAFNSLGHNVTALTASQSNSLSEQLNGISVFTWKSKFPKILDKVPISILDKLLYRFALFYLREGVKSNYYDKSSLDESRIVNKLGEIFKMSRPDVVMVSGAPFSLCYYIVNSLTNIPILVDFRDPWTWGKGYGMEIISSSRREIELEREMEIIRRADYITCPIQPMVSYLKEAYTDYEHKISLLPHGFEVDMNKIDATQSSLKSSKMKLIFGGTIYDGIAKELRYLISLVRNNAHSLDFEINAYNSNNFKLDIVDAENIHLNGFIDNSKFLQKVHGADLYLAIYPPKFKDYLSSKIFEIVKMGTPILLISEEGELSSFIEKNALGYHFTKDQLENMEEFLMDFVPHRINFENIEQYSFVSLAQSLITQVISE